MAYIYMHTVRSVHDHSSLSYSYVLMHAFMGLTLALVLSKDMGFCCRPNVFIYCTYCTYMYVKSCQIMNRRHAIQNESNVGHRPECSALCAQQVLLSKSKHVLMASQVENATQQLTD